MTRLEIEGIVMSFNVSFNEKAFVKFAEEFEDAVKAEQIISQTEKVMVETAGNAVRVIKKLTPDGKTHALRRGWSAGHLKRVGKTTNVDIWNSVRYAPFVEFGHRMVVHGKTVGYQPGKFMMKRGINYVEKTFEREVGKVYNEELKKIMGD